MEGKKDRFEKFVEEAHGYLSNTSADPMRGIGYAILALAYAVRESETTVKDIKLSDKIGPILPDEIETA